MDKLKVILSMVGLVLGGFVLAGTTHLIPMSDSAAIFLSGIGSLIAMVGVPIWKLTPPLAKALTIVSGIMTAAVGGYWIHLPAWQGFLGAPWFIVLVKVGGQLGIVAGVLGRSALGTPAAPAEPAAPKG